MKDKSEPELDQKLLSENNDHENCEYERSNKFLSLRFFISFVSLLGCAVMYMTRNNLNVAIVDMVTTFKSDPLKNGSTLVTDQCPIDRSNSSVNWKKGEFNWTPSTQGIVLGAFYYGYVWPQIFGGRLSEIYGAKYMIGFSIFISGLINLLTPFIIRYDFNLFILSRVLLGLIQGILFPSFMSLLAKWIPRSEHSTFIPWLDVGCTVGTVIVSAGAGHLIENNVMGGWPSVFYISGIVAILWCLIWFSFITSSPSTHSWITAKELKHIIKESETSKYRHIRQNFPWSKVLSSKAFIAVLMTKLLFGITWDFISAKIPAYLQDVIHFPISENGMIYSILMIALAVTTLGSGFIADAIIETKKISKSNVRKIFQTISGVGMAVTLVLIPFVKCDKQLNIALLTACTLLMGIPSGGDIPIIVDMTEEFAGTVFAIMNCISSINGFIVPYVVGIFIDKNPDSMQLWSYLFYFSAILNIIGVLIFALFSSAEPQHWECADFDNDYAILYDKKAVMKKKKSRVPDKYSL